MEFRNHGFESLGALRHRATLYAVGSAENTLSCSILRADQTDRNSGNRDMLLRAKVATVHFSRTGQCATVVQQMAIDRERIISSICTGERLGSFLTRSISKAEQSSQYKL